MNSKLYNGLPLYEATIADDTQGIYFISLVDTPAVERDFVCFNNKELKVRFALKSEEKHLISGVIMLPDVPLLQEGDNGYYYVSYSKDVIRQMAEKMLGDGTFLNIDLQHNFQKVEGCNLVEVYIKDTEKGLNPTFIEDIPDGTLLATFHITNEALWDEIKGGNALNGFSLAGKFGMKRVEMKKNNKIKNILNMKKITKLFVKFASANTDKGEISWAGSEDVKVGDEIFIETEGEAVVAEDGEYVLEDGRTVVIADGVVTEIREKEEVETPEEQPVEEPVENEEEPVEEPEAPVEEPEADEMAEIKAEIETLKAEIEAIKETLAKIVEQPQAEPIEDEFENTKHNDVKNKALPKSAQKAIRLFKK